MVEETKRYLTVDEVSRRLRVAPQTVYRWCRTGRLAAIKIGKEWRISGDQLGGANDVTGLMPLDKLLSGIGGDSEYLLGLAADRPAAARMEAAFFQAGASLGHRLVRILWEDDAAAVRQNLRPALPKPQRGADPLHQIEVARTYETGGLDTLALLLVLEIERASASGKQCFIYGSPLTYFRYQSDGLVAFARDLGQRVRGQPAVCICAYALTELIALYESRAMPLMLELMNCHTGVIWFDGQTALLQRPAA
jgi:excisionase family DNA binding protein